MKHLLDPFAHFSVMLSIVTIDLYGILDASCLLYARIINSFC